MFFLKESDSIRRRPYNGEMTSTHPFSTLDPDHVLDALASVGLYGDGRLLALNSYENRVYQVGIEDGKPVVVKFYRPGRWSDAAILEEHAFVAELREREIPAVPPLVIDGRTLHAFGQFRFAVFERHGGRVFSDADGWYQFTTIKPGAYPWRNHHNAWRPNHIHYSLFGTGFGQRVITQMYFPGDPLLALDPVYLSVPDKAARERLVAAFDIDTTVPEWALGYRFDFVLRGRNATPTEQG